MSDLVTGEAVPLELRLAKLPSRALAIMIDLLILLTGGGILLAILAAVTGGDDAALGAVAIATSLLVLIGVPTTIETMSHGRSVGKLALGLRVVRDDGGPVRFRHALIRALAGFVVDFILTGGAGAVISSILNERGKRVGDWLAGTVVVRERAPSTQAPLPAVPSELAQWATNLELSRLPDDLALAARNYLARGRELSPEIRDQMGAQLANEVSRTVTPPPPQGVPPWAYLAAVLGERGRRESARMASERMFIPEDASRSGTDDGPRQGAGTSAQPDQSNRPGRSGPPPGRNFSPPA